MPHIPGGVNLILILAVMLIVLGPEKVPDVARTMGRMMSEFRNAMREVTHHLDFSGAMSDSHYYGSNGQSLSGSTSGSYNSYDSSAYSSSPYSSESETGTPNPTDPHSGYMQASLPGGHSSESNLRANQSMNVG